MSGKVDVADLRVGDWVHARLCVEEISGGGFRAGHDNWNWRASIFHIEPRQPEPLKVGDWARKLDNELGGEIVAIDDKDAWLRFDHLGEPYHQTVSVANLERIP